MGKIKTPYLLLLPGFAFLFTFFILPIVNLAQTSTQTPIAGGDTGQYEQSFAFSNYINAFVENREQRRLERETKKRFEESFSPCAYLATAASGTNACLNSGGRE